MARLRLDVFTHNVKCTQFDAQAKQALLSYTANVARVDLVPDPDWDPKSGRRRKMVRKIIKVYAGLRQDRTEFRFHIHQYQELLQALQAHGIWEKDIEIVRHPAPDYAPLDVPLIDKRTPRDYQIDKIEYLKRDQRTKILIAQTGQGKALSLDEGILTPDGWATMADMEVGSKVVTPKGAVTEVTGVYPQGEVQLYTVTFADGRQVEACAEHLWKVYYINTSPHKRWRVVNTLDVMRYLSYPNPRVYVELIEPMDKPPANLDIDPYVLGVLLGDGTLDYTPSISNPDQEILDRVTEKLPPHMMVSVRPEGARCFSYSLIEKKDYGLGFNYITQKLKDYGLYGTRSHTKFIPDAYFTANKEQTLELLRGLLDTDGTVSKFGGTIVYTTTSLELALGVQYLVRSIGGTARIKEKIPFYTYLGNKKRGRKAYNITIRYKKPSSLFFLPRKKELTRDDGQYTDILKLRVASVTRSGVRPAQCISVADEDKLFVTTDFIPTHNTMMSMHAIHHLNKRVFLALTKDKYISKWIEDFEEAYGCKKGDIVVIKGTKQLNTLIECAMNDDLDAKIIICSMRTLQMYIEKYEAGEDVEAEYGCTPEALFPTLRVGIRFIDEVHEHFHTVYKLDLYSHVSETINLTATLIDDNPFVERMMRVMFPHNLRPPKSPYDKYIETLAYGYGLSDQGRRVIAYKQPGRGSYSHVRFEKFVMKHKKYLVRYLGFIQTIAEETFFQIREGKQRLLIFCSTIAMCEEVVKHFQKEYPAMTTAKFTGDDSYETLFAADIVVSTLHSAGTAVDIPDLRTAILTVAIGSRRQNVQALGRLRRLKNYPNTVPTFAYLVCTDIEEHHRYYEKKVEVFADKTLEHKVLHTSFSL